MRALTERIALLLLCLRAAGCGAEKAPVKIDWDLSHSHTMQDVEWDDPTSEVMEIDSVDSVRLRFSDGREVMEPGGIGRVNVARDDERLVDMAIFSEP